MTADLTPAQCEHGIPVTDLCRFVENAGIGVDEYRYVWVRLEGESGTYPNLEELQADHRKQVGGIIQHRIVYHTEWEVEL